jgi:hypothetical protein
MLSTTSIKNKKIYIYIYTYVFTAVSRGKTKKRGAQSHGPAPEFDTLCKHFKISVVFRWWGMSSIGSKPKSIRTLATCVT